MLARELQVAVLVLQELVSAVQQELAEPVVQLAARVQEPQQAVVVLVLVLLE